jgi:hypothetical protein
MYKRFFAFGCSFTRYYWGTWADILAANYPEREYYNFAEIGGGNQLILNRVMQADEYYNFTPNDVIMVQWTNVTREDRWLKTNINDTSGSWKCCGNIYSSKYYEDILEKYTCPENFFLRDLAAIKAVQSLLDFKQCYQEHFTMVPIEQLDQYNLVTLSSPSDMVNNLLNIYKSTINRLKPSYYTVLFNKDWNSRIPRPLNPFDSRPGIPNPDSHPTPYEHLLYLNMVAPELAINHTTRVLVEQETTRILTMFGEDNWHKVGNLGSLALSNTFNGKPLKRDNGNGFIY